MSTTDRSLTDVPLADLLAEAAAIRDAHHGNRVTYSPKVFIPLTMLCQDKCGYCTFAQPPARLDAPYLTPEQVLAIAVAGAEVGCHEALFTLGERPELRYPVAAEWLAGHGYASTVDYLAAMCALVRDETGLLPHANAGALTRDELAQLREVSASQGMMLESLNPDLDAHRGSPDKTPERRLGTLEWAGELQIPFTTGILVGIGESRSDRVDALEAIAESHRRHGHVQEVIVQNFLPKPGTAMHGAPPCPVDDHLDAVALARLLLPEDVSVQAPPNLSDDFGRLLDAGIDDWGGVSPVTADHVNPERPWPDLDRLAEVTEARGFALAPRLTVHPRFVARPDRWIDPALHTAVLRAQDAEGLARDNDRQGLGPVWYSGAPCPPPVLVPAPAPRVRGRIREIVDGVRAGETVGEDEIVALFAARGPEVAAVTQLADELRSAAVGDDVTWVSNRNINYTNVCTFKCRFCGFSKGPLSLNLRGAPYLLSLDDIAERVREAVDLGATEVCLQGGIHPDFDGDYYIDVARAVTAAAPDVHIHGFTALEVTEGARRNGERLDSYLRRLMDAGLRTLPGTAAEILDDETALTAIGFWRRARWWFAMHGINTKAILTDNGGCYRSKVFAAELAAAGGKGHVVHLLATITTKGARQQGKRRGDGLGDQVDDDLEDKPTNAELGVVQGAPHRQLEVDLATAVLEQGHGQLHRQLERIRAVHLVTKGQLIEEDLVAGRELAVFHLVVQLGRQLAFFDAIAHVFGRVGGHAGQLEVRHRRADVEGLVLTEGIEPARHLHGHLQALDRAGASDQEEALVEADVESAELHGFNPSFEQVTSWPRPGGPGLP